MNLHKNKTLFQQAVRFTAQEMRIPDLYFEKDYWVTKHQPNFWIHGHSHTPFVIQLVKQK